MAAVETKFKVSVEGVDKYINDLAEAEGLINDISDKLKKGDLSLDETVELTQTLESLEEIKVTMTLTNQVAERQVEIVAKQNTELGKQVAISETQLANVDRINEAYALQNTELGLAKAEAEAFLAVVELTNEAQVLATKEIGKQKAVAEATLQAVEIKNEAEALNNSLLGKQKAEAEALLQTVELENEANALNNSLLGKRKAEAEILLAVAELNNEATALNNTELGKAKALAESALITAELANEALALQGTELGKQKATNETALINAELENEALVLRGTQLGKNKILAESNLLIAETENEIELLLTSEVGKQRKQAEQNLVLAEAQAEAMAATPGSIRQLNAELEKANLELADLSPDSEGFKVAKNRAEQLQIQVDGLSRSSKEQREANFALADSFVGTFGKGGALVSSFAGENQNLQAVLLKLEQAMAAVEAVRSGIALIEQVQNELRLKQGKKLAEQKAKEIKITQEKAKAEKAEEEAIERITQDLKKESKAIEEVTEAKIELATVTEELTETEKQELKEKEELLKKAKEIREEEKKQIEIQKQSEQANKKGGSAFGFITDGIKGAIGGLRAFGAAILANPLGAFLGLIVLIGGALFLLKDKFKPIEKAFNTLEDVVAGFGNVIKNLGTALVQFFSGDFSKAVDTLNTAFTKGVEKSVNNRLLKEREALSKLTAISKNSLIERLALESKNADEVSKLKQKKLQDDIALAKERFKLDNNLSQSELDTLSKGTDAEIAALKIRLKNRGDYNDTLIEGLQEIADKENELAAEQKAQFDARVDAAKELRDLQFDIQTERLANEVGTDAEITRAKIEFEKTNNDINARLAKGEKVNLEERKLAQIKLANELAAIQKGISERTRDNLNSAKDIQEQADIDELLGAEAKSDKLIDVQEALAKNLQGIQKQSAFELEKIARDEQIALATIKDPTEIASKEAEFAAQRVQIAKKTELEIVKNAKASADAIEKDRLKKAGEEAKVIAGQAKLLTDKAKAQTEDALNREKNSKAKSLALLKESLANELQAIKSGEESQLRALGLSNKQIELLREKGVDGLSEAYKDLDKNVLDSAKNITDSSASATAQVIKDNAKNVAESEKGLIRITAKQQAAIDLATQILSAGLDNITAFTQQASEAQLAALDKQTEEINNRLDETNTRLDESKSKTDELNENLKKARGSERKSILANLKAIQNQEKALTKQKLDDEAKLKAIEEQKKAEQRKQAEIQKAVAISNAIIQTALAVISALGNTSIPAPFSLPFAITVGVIGAASIAQIAAQPIPEFAEGGYTPNVDRRKPVGVVHGGEWVAPKWMVESPKYRNDIMRLENMRSNGYATGGIVTTNTSTTAQADGDKKFDALINGIGALAQRPIYTNVVQVSDEQNRINNIRTKASL